MVYKNIIRKLYIWIVNIFENETGAIKSRNDSVWKKANGQLLSKISAPTLNFYVLINRNNILTLIKQRCGITENETRQVKMYLVLFFVYSTCEFCKRTIFSHVMIHTLSNNRLICGRFWYTPIYRLVYDYKPYNMCCAHFLIRWCILLHINLFNIIHAWITLQEYWNCLNFKGWAILGMFFL